MLKNTDLLETITVTVVFVIVAQTLKYCFSINELFYLIFDLVHPDQCHQRTQASFLGPINLSCFPRLHSSRILRCGKIY